MTAFRAKASGPGLIPCLAALATVAAMAGCVRYVESVRGPEPYYRSRFPAGDPSGQLRTMLESVRQIRTTAYYRTYEFDRETAPAEGAPIDEELFARARDTVDADVSRRATGVVVGGSGRRALLLTANHVVHFPDTLVERFGGTAGDRSTGAAAGKIRSVAVLTRRVDWVVGLPALDPFEVLASDGRSDLAFLGVEYDEGEAPAEVPVLGASPGDPDRLSWGSFVYVLGYPAGYPMVTRAIVGDPGTASDRPGSFTVDGVWNRGMSGGLILAVRSEGDTLEWIGTARAAAFELEHRLVPEEGAGEAADPSVPYRGSVYLEEEERILYGIGLSTSVEAVRRFADEHRARLRDLGYELSRF